MHGNQSFFNLYKQNNFLPIRLVTPFFGRLSPDITTGFSLTHRKTYYFFIFITEGSTKHGVDLEEYHLKSNELLFIFPHQIHRLPDAGSGINYFKIGFDEMCLSLLPKQYAFLTNPLNKQKISFAGDQAKRIKLVFEALQGLLSTMDGSTDLILAHLNSLIAEINAAYFSGEKNPAGDNLSKYINFKEYVEANYENHPSIGEIAEKLALNPNSLYNLVKSYSGLSPKEFISNRLILEAKRRLYYSESNIKELAYDLGFNDPEYFARLFKKLTGSSISEFVKDLSGN
ncbi:AraC family transcriptional regulator [Flavobacterium sp. J372]|uniref:AraC family transcriptional regulator n=1 Tax=Flavobacterium sp. J372 TaxID=2898436 RepID=UPI0021506EEF|nr:AraC family transcriptional regulator [Flavobacterium sp. J372]MCR5861571.1 AraC family transcriptional regulator [Flavobacterium sp. J372]